MTAMLADGFTDNAIKLLQKRYLEPGETVNSLLDRVSGGNDRFRRLMAERLFMPNSPTLMNKGTGKGTFSACFVFHVKDSLIEGASSIMNVATKAAAVAKWGGGVGYYFGHIRPRNAVIQSVHRKACGPVAVLKYYNEIGKLITQGGRRELAQMGILPWDHPDIRDFIHVKDNNPQSLNTFNISVSCTDEFMQRSTNPGAREYELWQEMGDSAWKTGDPGCYFFDTAERSNPTPHLGKLYSTNPCGEVPLLNGEPCNLGSINLGKMATQNRTVNWSLLEEVVVQATRFLDHILDANSFPHPDITEAAYQTRKLGLGVMGWADLLCLLHIPYDSETAINLARQVMEFIDRLALDTSIQLAKQNGGPYPGYREGPEARNATRTCIAPTGSIYLIAGADSSGIEPHYALETQRTMGDGTILNERANCIEASGGYVPKTAMEIDWRWHVQHQAAFQKHTNLAVSKTINMPNASTPDDMRAAYRMMWEFGCKGGTVFRDGCRAEQVLVDRSKQQSSESVVVSASPVTVHDTVPGRKRLDDERPGKTYKLKVGGLKVYLTANTFDDGTLAEIFLRVSPQQGSTVDGLLDTFAKTFSVALQSGASLLDLVKLHKNTRFEPAGLTGNPEIPVCTSIPDYVVRWLELRFSHESGYKEQTPKFISGGPDSGLYCPDCGASLLYQSGCLTCSGSGCGWSKCG